MDSSHLKPPESLAGEENDIGSTVDTSRSFVIASFASGDHESGLGIELGNKVTVTEEQKSPGNYITQDGLNCYVQESTDQSPNSSNNQQKVNGAIGRKGGHSSSAGKHALRQQARRRRRNTSIASGNSPPITRVSMKSGTSSSASSPSGISPNKVYILQTAQSTTTSPQSQTTPNLSSVKALGKVLPINTTKSLSTYQIVQESDSNSATSNNLTRIIIGKVTGQSLLKSSLDENQSYPYNEYNYLENNVFQLQDSAIMASLANVSRHSLLQSVPTTVRSSSRLAGYQAANCASSSYSGTSASLCPNNRSYRVCPPQSSPSTRDSSSPSLTTMQSYFASIPGFKPRKRSQRKLSTAAQIAQTKEGSIDLETPDSILVNVNLKSLINVDTFTSLSPVYQHKLAQLLPRVDQVIGNDNTLKVISTGFHNEFLARACVSWRERLSEAEFTHDNQVKLRGEAEKERSKLDPWKVAHFEPVWGMKQDTNMDFDGRPCSLLVSVREESESSRSSSSNINHRPYTSRFTDSHLKKLTKVVDFITSTNQRRIDRRKKRHAFREQITNTKDELEILKEESPLEQYNSEMDNAKPLSVSSSVLDSSFETDCLSSDSKINCNSTCSDIEIDDPTTEFKSDLLITYKRKNSPIDSESISKRLCLPSTCSEDQPTSTSKINSQNLESENITTKIVQMLPSICVRNSSGTRILNSLAMSTYTQAHKITQPLLSNSIIVSSGTSNQNHVSLLKPVTGESVANSSSLSTSPSRNSSIVTSSLKTSCVSTSNSIVTVSVTNVNSQISPKTTMSCSTSSYITKLNSQGVYVCAGNSSALIGQSNGATVMNSPKKLAKIHQVSPSTSGLPLSISKTRSPCSVNLQRSYEIVQGAITSCANRDNLQAKIVQPTSVISISKGSTTNLISKFNSLTENKTSNNGIMSLADSSLTIIPVSQQAQYVTKVSSINSIQPQTLAILKSIPSSNNHSSTLTHIPQSLGQILPTGQRLFRSVALPLNSLNNTSTAEVNTTQTGVSGDSGNFVVNSTSLAQAIVKESSKTTVNPNGPLTILRPAPSGKPVFLRTLSVSSVHLVRVSDIINNRNDGEQHPPRASSAPPARDNLGGGSVTSVIPRPSSVGPRILIPTSSSALSSFISSSPAKHFLSEGDPSSGVIKAIDSDCLRDAVESQIMQTDSTADLQRNEGLSMVARAGAEVRNETEGYDQLEGLHHEMETEMIDSIDSEQQFASNVSFDELENDIKGESSEIISEESNDKDYTRLSIENSSDHHFHSAESADFINNPTNEASNFMVYEEENAVTSGELVEAPDNPDDNECFQECKSTNHSEYITEETEINPEFESSSPKQYSQGEGSNFQDQKAALYQTKEYDGNSEEYTEEEEQVSQGQNATEEEEEEEIMEGTEEVETSSTPTNLGQVIQIVDNNYSSVQSEQMPQNPIQQANTFQTPQVYQMQNFPNNNETLLQQQMIQKQTYPIQHHHGSGVIKTKQEHFYPQNVYNQNFPMSSNVTNFHQVENHPVALNIHTVTNVNNNRVLNPSHTMNINANIMNMNYNNQVMSNNNASRAMTIMSTTVGPDLRKMMSDDDCPEDDKNLNSAEEGCPCNMRAMIACMKCGAFCHHDCISPSRLCFTCLIR